MAAEALVSAVTTKLTDLVIEKIVTEFRLQREVGDDIKFIRDELSTMKAFLKDAEKRRAREEVVNRWVAQVRDEAYKVEDVLEEFQFRMTSPLEFGRQTGCLPTKLSKFFICNFFKTMEARRQVHSQIGKIRKEIEDISRRSLQYNLREGTNSILEEEEEQTRQDHGVSHPFVEEDDIIGIDGDVETLQELLLTKEEANPRIIVSVVGMGGSGKTTIIKKVYKNISMGGEFECHAWVYVSQDFQVKAVLKLILQGFHESRREAPPADMETMALDKLRQTIYNYLQGKMYVLVLDDIWEARAWEGIKYALPNESKGRVIFTTRVLHVASPIGETYHIHQVELLSDELAWSLFCKKAFKNENPLDYRFQGLKRIGKEIVKRCAGLPLAIVAIGGLMSKKGTNEKEWNDVLENLDWELSNNQDLERLNGVLSTSYNYLPPRLKYCFLYCGMFPEDYQIKTSRLIRLWVAGGFIEDHPRKTLEDVAHEYLIQLVDRSMLQVDNEPYHVGIAACRMHDLMRDVAIHIIKKDEFGEIFTKQSNNKIIEGQRCVTVQNTSIVIPSSTVNTKTRSFQTFSVDKFPPATLLQMILSIKGLRVLDLSGTKIEHLPSDVARLIHLRYLSARGTQVKELPASLHKLYSLQTLDVRGTEVESLPFFPQLRHLLLSVIPKVVHLRFSPSGRTNNNSSNLQTLGNAAADENLVSHLCYLTQLRKLNLQEVKGEYCLKLCAAIEKMQYLRSLTLWMADVNEEEVFDLETMSSPPLQLENLKLYGVMKEGHLPRWISSLKCLRKCYFSQNKLTEDPLCTLAQLPNLEILILADETYSGRQIGWGSTGTSNNEERLRFLNLKYLLIRGISELEELSEIEEGIMPSLQILTIMECPKLKKLPRGVQHLKSLRELRIANMEEEFITRLRGHRDRESEAVLGGEDYWMIQHIPIVSNEHWSSSSSGYKFVGKEILNQN